MSEAEREAVEDGIRQFENGQWLSNEEANKRIDDFFKRHNSEQIG